MGNSLKKFVMALALPLAVGALSGYLAGDSMEAFTQLNKPSWAPPGWMFGPVWSILFLMMGISSYLVWRKMESDKGENSQALWLYRVQLIMNFFWSLIFFRMEWYLGAFIWLALLWIFIWKTIKAFYEISDLAAYLLVPYLLWVTYAGILNLAVFILN